MSDKEQQAKILPHSNEAEEAVLSAILNSPAALDQVVQVMNRADDFYKLAHRHIFEAMLSLSDKGQPCDHIQVGEELERLSRNRKDKRNLLEETGGLAFIRQLALQNESSANAVYHAEIVREKARLRDVIRTANMLQQEAWGPGAASTELIQLAETEFFNLAQGQVTQDFMQMRPLMDNTMEVLQAMQAGQSLLGVDTGFPTMNRIMSGWQATDLVILAARPSMGKTALALNFIMNAAATGSGVLLFSLEMSAEQLAYRMISTISAIESMRIRTKSLRRDDYSRLSLAVSKLADYPILIDETPGISMAELRSKARRAVGLHGIKMIVVDYLQLMSLPPRAESHQLGIAQISKGLKGLAKELKVPVIALSQLSRAVEQRGGDKRPMLSDLRDSGAIEQDADMVMFVYRPEMYEATDSEGNPTAGLAEVIIGKHRNGPTGTVNLHFNKDIGQFTELEEHHVAPPAPPVESNLDYMPPDGPPPF